MWVDPGVVTVLSGNVQNKSKCELEIDLEVYCKTYFEAPNEEALEAEATEEEGDNIVDRTSLNSVLAHLPMFQETKSMLEELVEKSGHILLLSSKYHAEVAGQGIEYCFGRASMMTKMDNSQKLIILV